MVDLLPSRPDTSAVDDPDPLVVGVDSEAADDLLAALRSDTGRAILDALYDDPASASALAERTDTSVQNVQYHLEKLQGAELVEVVDTVYSEKGREMKVYGPTARPLVVYAGSDEQTTGLETAVKRLIGSVGVLALASLVVERVVGPLATRTDSSDPDVGVEVDGAANATATPAATEAPQATAGSVTSTPAPTGTPTDLTTATDTVASGGGMGLDVATLAQSPGLLFFLGGLVALLVGFGVWYVRR